MTDHDPSTPQRIISLVPSTTETLFALELGPRVVGVTDFCIRPAEMPDHVTRVGGTKTPDREVIRELEPDLVLANQEENRREDVEALRAFTRVDVAYPRTVDEAVADLRRLGALLGVPTAAAALADEAAAAADDVRAAARPYRFAYLVWRRPWMAAGRDTFVDALLALGGGENVFQPDEERYPQTTLEAIAAREPDVLLLPDEPYPFEPRHRDEIADALGDGWRERCQLVPGDDYCWHGVRLLEGLPRYAGALRSGWAAEAAGRA